MSQNRIVPANAVNPFERHGIRHLSPSSLALYQHSPALWVLRYLFHVEDPATSYAWRGRAVEAGINSIILENASDNVAIERAKYTFELSALGECSPQIDKDRRAVAEMVLRAGALFRRLGKPLAIQRRVEYQIYNVEVPIIGYCDYVYEEFVVDLKTTFALPSMPRIHDAMQVVFYADCLSLDPGLVYVTPRKNAVYSDSMIDTEGARRLLRQSANAVRAMLAATNDKQHAASLFVPNLDDYRWTDNTRSAAMKVWL